MTDRLSKPLLLLIEDNPDEAQLIQRLIEQHTPDLATQWLFHAEQVLPWLENALHQQVPLPVMVVLDWYLPSAQRGLRVLQAIKAHQAFKHIPVVIFSRSDDPDDSAQALRYSATAYVTKPSNRDEWLGELTRISGIV